MGGTTFNFNPDPNADSVPLPDLDGGSGSTYSEADWAKISEYFLLLMTQIADWRKRKRSEEQATQAQAVTNTLKAINTGTMTRQQAYEALADSFEIQMNEIPLQIRSQINDAASVVNLLLANTPHVTNGIYNIEKITRNGVFDGYLVLDTTKPIAAVGNYPASYESVRIHRTGLVSVWTMPLLIDGRINRISERGFQVNYSYLFPQFDLPEIGKDLEVGVLDSSKWQIDGSNVIALNEVEPTKHYETKKDSDGNDVETTTITAMSYLKENPLQVVSYLVGALILFGKPIIKFFKNLSK